MVNERYQLIVFDWDGTLSDSCGQILDHLQESASELGLDTFDRLLARGLIGLNFTDIVLKLYPDIDNHSALELLQKYRFHHAKYSQEVKLFPHVRELLEKCRQADILLAIATSCSTHGLRQALAESGLEDYFCHVRTADQCLAKPHPQMLMELMEVCAVDSKNTLMLGDNLCDIQLANNAGVDAIGVDFGSGHGPALLNEGARAVISEYTQLETYCYL